jgi:hypothetical protein
MESKKQPNLFFAGEVSIEHELLMGSHNATDLTEGVFFCRYSMLMESQVVSTFRLV